MQCVDQGNLMHLIQGWVPAPRCSTNSTPLQTMLLSSWHPSWLAGHSLCEFTSCCLKCIFNNHLHFQLTYLLVCGLRLTILRAIRGVYCGLGCVSKLAHTCNTCKPISAHLLGSASACKFRELDGAHHAVWSTCGTITCSSLCEMVSNKFKWCACEKYIHLIFDKMNIHLGRCAYPQLIGVMFGKCSGVLW